MSNKIDPKKLPSTDWDWLEENNLWDRNTAAEWFLPLGNKDVAFRLLANDKQFRMTTNKQLGRTAESFSGANLINLRGMGKLKKLSAPRNVNDEGLKYIGELGKLTTLHISGDGFTNEGLKQLSSLVKLKCFSSEWLPEGDGAIKILASLPKISSLGLNETNITDDDLIPLIGTDLKSINVGAKNITGACLKHLGKITSLEEIMIGKCPVTDDSLKHISGLVNLKRLALGKTQVTAEGLKHLASLTSLKKLRLNKDLCSTPEAKALKNMIPGLSIRDNA